MRFIKLFEEFENDTVVSFGDYVLTKHDLDTKYRQKIIDYYGDYTEDTIIEATYTLKNIEYLYNNGGGLYRAIWLKDINEFNKNKLGKHWVFNKGDIDNIVQIFRNYDYDGDIYVIEAKTPPHNVSIPHDYWNCLDENEILVVDDKKLEFIKIYKYEIY